jgi:tRNA A-37 threonylcarbamoyl transferase component Bud32
VRLVPGEEFGRYRIEAEIGRGGQAVVYRATQLDLDRQVALKVFDEGYLERGGALERFRREAIAAGRLEHPRIVPVYDAGEIDGRAFMSMRLVPGDSLAERIARTGPLPPGEAVAMLADIADALDFAHARGTVHRDVKPANILLDPEGCSFLSDFGLVRLDDMPGLTRRGDWLGTPEYVSPEQVEGEPATVASDVYALSAVAFEALTGRAPYVRREPSAVLLAHVRDDVPEASAVAPTLPTAVDAVLAAGLAKDPADRPGHAHRLVDDLRLAIGSSELRPTLTGATAPAAWDAALARFADPTEGAPPARPTIALGGVRSRRERLLGAVRDVRVAAGVGVATLLLVGGVGGWFLGGSHADASGAHDSGYAAGQVAGQKAGFAAGQKAGIARGNAVGIKKGKSAGRKAGYEDGYAKGLATGKQDGYASGLSTGRSTALGELAPGGWYIVSVGSDGNGPQIASSQPVASDASQCYAVSGGTVLSGKC